MSHHWRSHVGRADVIQGAGDHDVEYFGGWVISAALTLATVLVNQGIFRTYSVAPPRTYGIEFQHKFF